MNGRSARERDLARRAARDRRVVDVRALEHLRQAAQEARACDASRDQHDVEQAVVEPRVGREVHAAAVDAGVRHGDASSPRTSRALAVDVDARSARASSAAARAARRRRRRASPSRAGASLAIRLASESKPQRGDAEERAAVDVADVDRALARRRRSPSHGRDRVERDPELAREVVAAAAGEDAEHGAGAVAQLAGDRADEPVAAERGGDLAARRRAVARELARVLERRACARRGTRTPSARSARLDARAAAARRGRRRRAG